MTDYERHSLGLLTMIASGISKLLMMKPDTQQMALEHAKLNLEYMEHVNGMIKTVSALLEAEAKKVVPENK